MEENDQPSVAELGESGVLRRILDQLSPANAARLGPGDDCAVVAFDGQAVVTTDTMIEGSDFRLSWHSGFELGFKLAATNLSDVAAMGAVPTGLTVALACPEDTPVSLLEDIARGLDAACRELAPGCGVVGGDLTRAPIVLAAIAAFGDLSGVSAVTRDGARAGDVVAYAGQLGLAGLGLALLFAHEGASPAELGELRGRHEGEISAQLTPRPPIHLGPAAAHAGATAMLDVSDGLVLDASRISRASAVTIDFATDALRESFGVQAGVEVPLEAMLFGGEDHGLLATFPSARALPEGFHPVGVVRSAAEARAGAVLLDGEACEPRGWDPFTVQAL